MKLLYATTNQYKLKGAQANLSQYGITLYQLKKPIEVTELQSSSQEVVSIDKAKKYFNVVKRPLVVMDSGIFIDNLQGFPGVYTKYILDTIGIDGILKLVQDFPQTLAYTQRTITYADGTLTKIFSSKVHGRIINKKLGHNGRDYDLVFIPNGKTKTLAEMTDEEKTKLTSPAWDKFAKWYMKKAGEKK